jgi:hypothetical protein
MNHRVATLNISAEPAQTPGSSASATPTTATPINQGIPESSHPVQDGEPYTAPTIPTVPVSAEQGSDPTSVHSSEFVTSMDELRMAIEKM